MPKAEKITCEEPISVRLLGGFEMVVGNKLMSESMNRTRQMWNLLEYFIAFRHKTISREELIHALWPQDDSDNPANALKNLVYRIRTQMTACGIPFAKEIICYRHGVYFFNNSLACTVDTEEFERLMSEASAAPTEDAKIKNLLAALALYRGDFLPGASYEEWVVPLAEYYRSQYFQCVSTVVELLLKQSRFEEVQTICEKAIMIDSLEERSYKYLMYALAQQGKSAAALERYRFVTDLFYRELGVQPSESMRRLYNELVKSDHGQEPDILTIKSDLEERGNLPGAFCCDYEVFKNMYRIEARTNSRTGRSTFLGLFTVSNAEGEMPEKMLLNKAMDQLLYAIQTSLRSGDVVSRFSTTQYVLMLPSLTLENGQMVVARIEKCFRAVHRQNDIKLSTVLQPLNPAV